jgi:uncharacterized repeat protein (TIGR03803 family)
MGKLGWVKRAYAVVLLCATTAVFLPAQTLGTLHSFDWTDGAYPNAALVQATDGNLYGTTGEGGTNGDGTVFKIAPSGLFTTLHSFDSTDGFVVQAGLVQGIDGSFYGTTEFGGANGEGTIFKITPSGLLTTLYSFCSQSGCTDGYGVFAGLMQATDGNFYGAAAYGGVYGHGTVFKITPSGTLTTLYSFCPESGCPDGYSPVAGLVQATDGNFYGIAPYGGANSSCLSGAGCGTVFKITPGGVLSTLYSFGSQSGDGTNSYAGLIQATDGNFYGTAVDGGANGQGTVFKVTPRGTETTLYSFGSQSGDGENPYAALIQATDGNFYGTTYHGGASGGGTLFKITPGGALTTLYGLGSQSGDGLNSYAALIQDTNGKFYGTAVGGGASGDGTVFSLSVGLGQFVETRPTSGKVGKPVTILGTNLAGATNVTFNGTPATFTPGSKTAIKATVPAGATTGTVQVVTPHGTLSSNVPFRVLP